MLDEFEKDAGKNIWDGKPDEYANYELFNKETKTIRLDKTIKWPWTKHEKGIV